MQFEPLNIPLVDLEPHHCREVVSPDGVTAYFCGHPQDGDTIYCIHHRRINLEIVTGKMRPFIRPRVRAA